MFLTDLSITKLAHSHNLVPTFWRDLVPPAFVLEDGDRQLHLKILKQIEDCAVTKSGL